MSKLAIVQYGNNVQNKRARDIIARPFDRSSVKRYLPPHTVPATLVIGTPTVLPYSVHDPS